MPTRAENIVRASTKLIELGEYITKYIRQTKSRKLGDLRGRGVRADLRLPPEGLHCSERGRTASHVQSAFKARWGVAHGTLTDLRPPHYASAYALDHRCSGRHEAARAVRAAFIRHTYDSRPYPHSGWHARPPTDWCGMAMAANMNAWPLYGRPDVRMCRAGAVASAVDRRQRAGTRGTHSEARTATGALRATLRATAHLPCEREAAREAKLQLRDMSAALHLPDSHSLPAPLGGLHLPETHPIQ